MISRYVRSDALTSFLRYSRWGFYVRNASIDSKLNGVFDSREGRVQSRARDIWKRTDRLFTPVINYPLDVPTMNRATLSRAGQKRERTEEA